MTSGATSEPNLGRMTRPSIRYSPGWIDRVSAWADRLPVPAWVFFLSIWLVFFAVQTTVACRDEAYPAGTLFPFHAVFSGLGFWALALWQAVNDAARSAFSVMQPTLTADEAELEQLKFELEVAPARGTLLASIAGLAVALIIGLTGDPAGGVYLKISTSPLATVINDLAYLFQWWVFGGLAYHVFRQLRVVNRIYSAYATVDLFYLHPYYAFSRLTSRVAIVIGLFELAWTITFPSPPSKLLSQPLLGLIANGAFALFAVGVFVLPLLGAHRRLEEEKQHLLSENGEGLKAAIAELHRRPGAGGGSQDSRPASTLESLIREREFLASISTWPWRLGAVRLVVTAVLLPVLVTLLERLASLVITVHVPGS
jgi:hypothetical protein